MLSTFFSPRGRRPARARRPVLVMCAVLGLVAAACSSGDAVGDPLTGNPFAERAQAGLTNQRLVGASKQAEADGDSRGAGALARLAEVPTGIWLTPEHRPPGDVTAFVSSVMSASAGRTVPVFVVYGIPDRDCTGQYSAGGLPARDYLPWVREIAEAVGDQGVVVLEPDALAGSLQCEDGDERVRLLSEAVGVLDAARATTYVDAGHSDWVPAPQMARLLTEVGVDRVRGFATNVSNYQPQPAEIAFATELSSLLDGARYVIDTGRNGDPAGTGQVVADWCNPRDRALGQEPGFVDDGSALDALLWIKPPAESDGTCHGGPPAGDVWIDRAVELAEAAGW